MLNDLSARILDINERKGWNKDVGIAESIANIHTEISEAWECIRNNRGPTEVWFETDSDGHRKPEGFPIELIDAIIRILHLLAYFDLDVDKLMDLKLDYNETRPYRHGGKRC